MYPPTLDWNLTPSSYGLGSGNDATEGVAVLSQMETLLDEVPLEDGGERPGDRRPSTLPAASMAPLTVAV